MALAFFQNDSFNNNATLSSPDASVPSVCRSALPSESIEQAVLDLRRKWRLTLPETCVLHQAAMGYSDQAAASRLARTPGTIGKNWQSIREKSGYDDHRRAVFDVWQRATPIR
jgi:DNA-binding NarL/FixJ family response regulator